MPHLRNHRRRARRGLAIVSLAIASVGAAAFAPQAQAAPVPILAIGNHHYFYTTSATTWSNAEAEAVADGGHLAAITSAGENAALVAAFGGTERLWIGLTDAASLFTFVWTSGEAFVYSNWSPGEPNNGNGQETVVAFNWSAPGNWNDLPNAGFGSYDPALATPIRGIIEVVPEPDVAALLAIAGAAGFLARRRRTA